MQIKINNKTYPVNFSLAAFKNFCKIKNIDYPQLDILLEEMLTKPLNVQTSEDFGLLIICGVKNALRIEKRLNDFDLDIDDAVDLVQDKTEMAKVFEVLIETLPEPEKTEQQGNAQPPKENH